MDKNVKRSDVLVIGGGPSGLRLGARLADRGLDVRILEKKSRIGGNVICTGIVGKETYEKFGLDRDPIIREIQDVRLVSPFETVLKYRHPRPFAYIVDRGKFDGSLAETARSRGVAIELDTRVDDIRIDSGGVGVEALDKEGIPSRYSSAMAVIATGVDYRLHKQCGLGYPKDFLKGAQVELPLSGQDITTIYVGKNVAPGAFAWAVPAAEGTIRIGLLTRKDAKGCLEKLLDIHFDGKIRSRVPVRTKAIAQGLLSRTVADRVLSVGEAAGQVKTTTGGGLSYGLMCADLAVDVIARCFATSRFGSNSLSDYEKQWRNALQKEIVVGYYTRRMCSLLSDTRVESLFRLAQTDGIIPIVRETADFELHSGLIEALLQRLSFMKFFKLMKDHLGIGNLS